MPKNIVSIKPSVGESDLRKLLSKKVAAVIFSIEHQNYGALTRMVERVRAIGHEFKRPISTILDISDMEDDLDLNFGIRNKVDWIITDKLPHLKQIRNLSKSVGIIYKGRDLPKDVKVDSISGFSFIDPDAVLGKSSLQIKHLVIPHAKQTLLDSLIDIAIHGDLAAIVVSDLELAKGLIWRRPKLKVIYSPQNSSDVAKAALYGGIEPIFAGQDICGDLKASGLINKNEKVLDATDIAHVVFK